MPMGQAWVVLLEPLQKTADPEAFPVKTHWL